MNIFFEESGSFKAGAVLSTQGAAFHVELPGGRRIKVKGREVLIEFEAPSAAEWLKTAHEVTEQIDIDFLWECAPVDAFHFVTLADEYFGASVGPVQRAALALKLQSAPIYFRRKGRGYYQRAPEDQLNAAIAALKRRAQQLEIQAGYEAELKAKRLPDAFKDKVVALLTWPDKQSIEYKALEAAAAALGTSKAQLMLDCGGIASARALHEARFLAEYFPQGTGFPPVCAPALTEAQLSELPESNVSAFSIDDITTTEIDDAFSVQRLTDDRICIGIHIAAPTLGISPSGEIDTVARARLSTVYVPGGKITMLPEAIIDIFSLKEGDYRPALSLYLIVESKTQQIIAVETRLERVFVAANLRYPELNTMVTEETLTTASTTDTANTNIKSGNDYPHQQDIAALWPFAQALHKKRQQARISYGLKAETRFSMDFNFYIEGDHVTIVPRPRHSPIDLIVSELAIFANSNWGKLLAEHGVPGIYRIQRAFGQNRTRMQTAPAPHEGLGVAQYAWSTSPLRRYIDLVNQQQLTACVQHGMAAKLAAPFKPEDATLYSIVQDFTETHAAYMDHQHRMERFWCLRWLKQEKRERVVASVVNGELVRLDEIPLLLHVPGLGIQAHGTKLWLNIVTIDELTVDATCRLSEIIHEPALQR